MYRKAVGEDLTKSTGLTEEDLLAGIYIEPGDKDLTIDLNDGDAGKVTLSCRQWIAVHGQPMLLASANW